MLLIAAPSFNAGCAGPGDDAWTAAVDGSLQGELAVYISDDEPGVGSRTRYFLRDLAGAERPLLFDRQPDVAPGTWLKVWGADEREALRVLSFQPIPAPAAVPSALIAAAPYAARSFAFILVDIGGGINRTADDVMARMITAPDSIRNHYLAGSYGRQDISATVIEGLEWTPTGCDTGQMAQQLRPAVDAQGGPFQHYLWYYGSRNNDCTWSGLASVGMPDRPSANTWYNASTSCVVLVQEPGHNFGMQHSSSLACPGAAFADDPNTCEASEYGDRFDPMGGGCRHMNAWQKDFQGWFGGCNGVKVTGSGTFTLVPFELSCSGVQYLQVKAPKPRSFNRPAAGGGAASTEDLSFYYLELRTPRDFDGTLGNSTELSPRVLVHVAGDRRPRTQRGAHTFLLDMTPETTGSQGVNDAGLRVGQTFTDPAGGLSITAQSISETGATIVVEYANGGGAPTCIDGSAFAAPGPGIESCAPAGSVGPGTGGSAATGSAGRGGPGGDGTAGTGGSVAPGESPPDGMGSGGCDTAAGSGSAASLAATLLALAVLCLGAVARRLRRR